MGETTIEDEAIALRRMWWDRDGTSDREFGAASEAFWRRVDAEIERRRAPRSLPLTTDRPEAVLAEWDREAAELGQRESGRDP